MKRALLKKRWRTRPTIEAESMEQPNVSGDRISANFVTGLYQAMQSLGTQRSGSSRRVERYERNEGS